MKAGEFLRIVGLSLLGAVVMFFGQPWIYENRLIRISDVRLQTWLADYQTGAAIVYGCCLGSVALWSILTGTAKVKSVNQGFGFWRGVWAAILLIPIVGIGISLYYFNKSSGAVISLTGFFILDVAILFWLTTATSTPGTLRYAPPAAFLLRRFVRG